MENLNAGRYTVLYPNGDYRTLRVKDGKGKYEGQKLLSYRVAKGTGDFGGSWICFGTLNPDGSVRFWFRFRQDNSAERLDRISKAVRRIVEAPAVAGLAYAMKENCCYRCGHELTVPASIHAGMGPECARKGRWTRPDQVAVYEAEVLADRPAPEAQGQLSLLASALPMHT